MISTNLIATIEARLKVAGLGNPERSPFDPLVPSTVRRTGAYMHRWSVGEADRAAAFERSPEIRARQAAAEAPCDMRGAPGSHWPRTCTQAHG